jgi:hypothetical protein
MGERLKGSSRRDAKPGHIKPRPSYRDQMERSSEGMWFQSPDDLGMMRDDGMIYPPTNSRAPTISADDEKVMKRRRDQH